MNARTAREDCDIWRRWLLLAQSRTTAQLARLHPIAWQILFLALLDVVLLMWTNALE